MVDERRPFRGPNNFDRGRDNRGDRPERPAGDRPGFNAGPRPFPPRPATRGGDLPPAAHTVRIRSGERELEVTGAPAFVRQILDDLPTLVARLTGEAPAKSAVALPALPPAPVPVIENGHADPAPANGPAVIPAAAASPRRAGARGAHVASPAEVEELVFGVLRGSTTPLAVAAIRKKLPAAVTGQQVRRILERADDRVRASAERPATYSLR